VIRKLRSGEYRLYSRKIDPHTGKRRNLGTFATRAAAEKHERAVQFFKRQHALLKPLSHLRQEHEVMGQHTEVAFSFTRGVRSAAQRTAQPTLVTRECRLHLPTLAEHTTVSRSLRLLPKSLHHLTTVLRLRPLAALAPTVQGNHRRADLQVLAAITMMGLTVEGGVGQQTIPVHDQGRLGHDRTQLRRIVGRAGGHRGPGDEVAGGIDRDRELGPEPRGVPASGSLEEVSRGVTTFETGTVNGDRRRFADQAAVDCGRGGTMEKANDLPFFSSRWAA